MTTLWLVLKHTAVCLDVISAMTNVVTLGLAVMEELFAPCVIEKTKKPERLPKCGLQFLPHIVFYCPVTTIVLRVRYGHVFGDIRSLVPRFARKHRLVQAPGPGLTVSFLTFLVLAEGGGGG